MAKRERIRVDERLKSTMVQAFQLWRPFEEEFRGTARIIQDRAVELAAITAGQEYVSENIAQLVVDLVISAESLKTLVQQQVERVTELGVASMKMKEIEDDPGMIGDLIMDAATIMENWKQLVQMDAGLLAQSLMAPLPTTRVEALRRLPAAVRDEWLDAILEIKAGRENG